MEQVNISDLRANLLKYLKKAQSGHPFAVTSNGELLATISSPDYLKKSAKDALNELSVTAKVGDIVSTQDESWDVMQ